MTTTKTTMSKVVIRPCDRSPDVMLFEEPKSGSSASVYEYYNKTDYGCFSYSLSDIWVPVTSRGSGIGNAILRTILGHYDEQGESLRLVAAGCCAPTRNDGKWEVDEMHSGNGHYGGCDQQDERLSHHGLQRWYRSFGFVDHEDSPDDLCCSYYLYRAHHG